VPGSYRVTVYLLTNDQQRSENTYDDFKPVPPPQPSWISVAFAALTSNPIYLGLIALIIASLAGVFFFNNKKRKEQEPAIVRPPVDKSIVWSKDDFNRDQLLGRQNVAPDEEDFLAAPIGKPAPTRSAQQRLYVRVVQTNSPTSMEKIVDSFPLVIGREGVDLNISGDNRISRRHVEISLRGDQFYVTDLGGVNGTFLENDRLPAKTPIPLGGKRIVRLSSQTHLELDPQN